jgi:hypothetical protein
MIVHYVRPEDEGDYDAAYTRIKAVCGAECLLDPEGEIIPDDFDFVIAPDPRHITDCMPCLVKIAERCGTGCLHSNGSLGGRRRAGRGRSW